jgi:hypothetical protein
MHASANATNLAMFVDYSCVFGISSYSSLKPGGLYITYDKNVSAMTIGSKNGRTYWFLYKRLGKTYVGTDIPRYTKMDAEKTIAELSGYQLAEGVTVADLWRTQIMYTQVPLEEALYEKWAWGRIAMVGDAAHKVCSRLFS